MHAGFFVLLACDAYDTSMVCHIYTKDMSQATLELVEAEPCYSASASESRLIVQRSVSSKYGIGTIVSQQLNLKEIPD